MPVSGNTKKTFVAFPGSDRSSAEQLVQHLRGFGVTVVWEQDLAGNQQFTGTIPEAMEACASYVFLVTAASSSAHYQHDEATIAVEWNRLERRSIHVVTDLSPTVKIYGLASFPRLPWANNPSVAAFRIAADLLKWKTGAHDDPPQVPLPDPDPRYPRQYLAATLALAIYLDGVPKDVIHSALDRRPLTKRFAAHALTDDVCHVLRGALFQLADGNADGWRDSLVAFGADVAQGTGSATPKVEAWLAKAGRRAPVRDASSPPALLVRIEGLTEDGTFFMPQMELRRPGADPLWRNSSGPAMKRRPRQDLADLLFQLNERKLATMGISLDALVLIVEIDAKSVGARFHRWPGCDPGRDLARQLRVVATWPCTAGPRGETRARPPSQAVSYIVPRPKDGPSPSLRLRAPVDIAQLNGPLGAEVAVFADLPAWRDLDASGRGPVSAHAGRLLTLLIEDAEPDELLDELFGTDREISIGELFERLRQAWLHGHEAHIVWTDPRYTPSWNLSFGSGDPLFDSLL